jgi:leucyl aminopeptidase
MVKVRAHRGGPQAAKADMLLLPLTEEAAKAGAKGLGAKLGSALTRRMRDAGFRGRQDELLPHQGERSIAVIGLGRGPVTPDALRRAGARGRQEAERQRVKRVAAYLGDAAARPELLAAFVEGFHLSGYRFSRYLSDPARQARVESLELVSEAMARPAEVGDTLAKVEAVVTEIFRARDFINEPASVATPVYLASQVKALAREIPGLEFEAWGPARLEKEGIAGLLAVARGSREEPRLMRLRWKGKDARRRVALIGKAITFDSGGLSLKPPKSMETMKYDMAGGAAVVGAVAAAARLRLPIDVTGYVPTTENLPGGNAQKPGDVIRFLNGRTVEVLNTDAEGRLVLADALALASREKPDAIVDLATLTGACRVALGTLYAAIMGNSQELVDQLVAAGRASGELLWQLPLVQEYRDDLKSPIADLKNVSSGGEAGSIIGGLFLQEFVDGAAWAHLDIAGPAFAEKDLPHAPRGGTGFGVRLLVRYLTELSAAGAQARG